MTNKFLHESTFRGTDLMERLTTPLVTVCGAGAIGSNLVDSLARQGFQNLRVIDFDRVEEHNVNTQIYDSGDVGALKVDVLRNRLFHAVEIEIDAIGKRLEDRTVKKQLKESAVVIDTFDNSASRRRVQEHCRSANLPCLHTGLFADYCEVIWDPIYRIPGDAEVDVCDYPLARNLVLLSVALTAETLIRYFDDGQQISRSCTLIDFAIHELPS